MTTQRMLRGYLDADEILEHGDASFAKLRKRIGLDPADANDDEVYVTRSSRTRPHLARITATFVALALAGVVYGAAASGGFHPLHS